MSKKALILFAFLLSGCVLLNVTEKGYDPTALIDWPATYQKAAEAGKRERAGSEPGLSNSRLERTATVSTAAQAAFDEVETARKDILDRLPKDPRSIFEEYEEFHRVRKDMESTAARVIVVGTDAPFAVTYPDHTIVVARRLV